MMMAPPVIACIVSGHGEVEAVPMLVRRIGSILSPPVYPTVLPPIRISESKLLKEGELERSVDLAARKTGGNGAILILIDCDDDCPATLGPRLLLRAQAARTDRLISVVLAKKEYEAWFLAGAVSLRNQRELSSDLEPPDFPESIRDCKGWLSHRKISGKYSETTDQPALTAVFDVHAARVCDSFDKCYREITRLLTSGCNDLP